MSEIRIKVTGVSGCMSPPTDEPMMVFGVILTLFDAPVVYMLPTPLREVKVSGVGVVDGEVMVRIRRQLTPVLRNSGILEFIEIKSGESFEKTFTLTPTIPAKYIDMEFQALASGFKNPKVCWNGGG